VTSSSFRLGLVALAVALLVVLLCSNALENDFVTWDDQWYVLDNEHIRISSADDLLWIFTHSYYWSYIPLTLLSHALDYSLWGLDPRGHHLTSVLIHAANSVWVFLLALAVLRFARLRAEGGLSGGPRLLLDAGDLPSVAGAVLAALFFSVHPLRAESVAWVSDRKDLLCAFFLFPAFLSYLFFSTARGTPAGRHWYRLSLLLQLCALLSKAAALMFPLVLVAFDLFLCGRVAWKEQRRTLLRDKLPYFVLSGTVGLIGMASVPAKSVNFLAADLTLLQKVFLPFHSIMFPLAKFLWPINLGPVYDYPGSSLTMILALVLFLLVTGFCIVLFKLDHPAWLASWMYYLIMSVPTALFFASGIQPIADRYTYVSTVSFFILFGGVFAGVLSSVSVGRWKRMLRFLVAIGAVVWLVALAVLSRTQVSIWKDPMTLWSRGVQVAPGSPFAYNNLAEAQIRAGFVDDAVVSFLIATELKPDYADGYNNLGVSNLMKGEYREGIRWLNRARELFEAETEPDPSLADVYCNLGYAHQTLGEDSLALEMFSRTLGVYSGHAKAHYYIGMIFERQGRTGEAMAALEEAARLGYREARVALEERGVPWEEGQ
jgi:Tfp pilus assembly protein PilF